RHTRSKRDWSSDVCSSDLGEPYTIPELSYEEFLDFHRKFYHPSNSYIYLYGNIDLEKELEFINDEYLQNFDYIEVDSSIETQTRSEERRVGKECDKRSRPD